MTVELESTPQDRLTADAADSATGLRTAAPDNSLSPQIIAQWLGISVDGRLTLRSPAWIGYALAIGMLALIVYMLSQPGSRSSAGGLFYWLFFGVAMVLSVNKVYADVDGISIGRGKLRRQYAWADIKALKGSGSQYTVETTNGKFRLFGVCAKKVLIDTIRKVLDARAQGFELPDAPPMPEGALSAPSLDGSADAERGLSVATDDDGGAYGE